MDLVDTFSKILPDTVLEIKDWNFLKYSFDDLKLLKIKLNNLKNMQTKQLEVHFCSDNEIFDNFIRTILQLEKDAFLLPNFH